MWDLPRPGIEPVSPALASRFLTTAPPGKSWESFSTPTVWKLTVSSVGVLLITGRLECNSYQMSGSPVYNRSFSGNTVARFVLEVPVSLAIADPKAVAPRLECASESPC